MKVNNLYPGQPNYTGPNEGWFIFIHHAIILEYSDDIQERVTYIQRNKPKYEQATRLACLTYVKPSFVVKLEATRQAYNTAMQAFDTTWRVYDIARQAFDTTWQVYDIARQDFDTTWRVYDTAWQAYHIAKQSHDTAWLKKHFPRQAKSWDAKNQTLIYKGDK